MALKKRTFEISEINHSECISEPEVESEEVCDYRNHENNKCGKPAKERFYQRDNGWYPMWCDEHAKRACGGELTNGTLCEKRIKKYYNDERCRKCHKNNNKKPCHKCGTLVEDPYHVDMAKDGYQGAFAMMLTRCNNNKPTITTCDSCDSSTI